jgi:hypothetical protein
LQNIMVPSEQMLYPVRIAHFQQDNSSIHDSSVFQEWLSLQAEVELIDWPSRAPDMNPIEKMWIWRGQCRKPGLPSLPEIAMNYDPMCQTREMKLLRLGVTFHHWLSPWHYEWNQWPKHKGSGLLIKEVTFWKQPL